MNKEIIIPLLSKDCDDYTEEDRFLNYFKKENIYIMDNHRLSLWCWLNNFKKEDFGKYAYIHIDDHFDCGGREDIEGEMIKKINENGLNYYKNINNFRNAETNIFNENIGNLRKNYKIFNWGNYLTPALYLNFFNNDKLYFFVEQNYYDCGGLDNNCIFNKAFSKFNHYQEKNINNFKKVFEKENNIILNLDFDYFFEFIDSGKEFIVKDFFEIIKLNFKKIKLTTIALTPGNKDWEKAEKILNIFNKICNFKITL